MKKIFLILLSAIMALTIFASCKATDTTKASESDPYAANPNRWNMLLGEYRDDPDVNQLIFIRGEEGSKGTMFLYVKDKSDNTWNREIESRCYVGKNGMGDASYCANITPEGVYGVSTAFGIKENPGTSMPYYDFNNENLYCCGCQDSQYYNQLIDVSEVDHENCEGEHVVDYSPQYNYGMFLDYNKENDPKEDFAIFFHAEGINEFTGGCIAVPENIMKEILQKCDANVKVCIYKRVE